MREILFRGKRVDNGEWVEGFYSPVRLPIVGEMGHFINEDGYRTIEVKKETVGQYTGLTDINGVKIFEGDIVRDMEIYEQHFRYFKRGEETQEQAEAYRYIGEIGAVEFCTEDVASCGCCYTGFSGTGFKANLISLHSCEVLGNIHDNPELLKKE